MPNATSTVSVGHASGATSYDEAITYDADLIFDGVQQASSSVSVSAGVASASALMDDVFAVMDDSLWLVGALMVGATSAPTVSDGD